MFLHFLYIIIIFYWFNAFYELYAKSKFDFIHPYYYNLFEYNVFYCIQSRHFHNICCILFCNKLFILRIHHIITNHNWQLIYNFFIHFLFVGAAQLLELLCLYCSFARINDNDQSFLLDSLLSKILQGDKKSVPFAPRILCAILQNKGNNRIKNMAISGLLCSGLKRLIDSPQLILCNSQTR